MEDPGHAALRVLALLDAGPGSFRAEYGLDGAADFNAVAERGSEGPALSRSWPVMKAPVGKAPVCGAAGSIVGVGP